MTPIRDSQTGAVVTGAGGLEPRATVVITACSIGRGLLETLGLVRQQADEVGAEVLVVFNTSPLEIGSAACQRVAEHADQVVFEPKPGKSAALNTAVAAARSDVIVFTDDDASPAAGWLEALVDRLEADPELAGAGGPVEPVLPEEGVPDWYARLTRSRPTSHLGPKHRLDDDAREYAIPARGSICPVPLGANCAWRKPWLQRFPYREDLGPNRCSGLRGGEDTCFAIETLESGGRVGYVAGAVVRHPVESRRLSREFVVGGARIQGREYARIMKALRRSIPNPVRLARSAGKGRRAGPAGWLETPYRALKRELRQEFARGVCEELGWDWEGVSRDDARSEAAQVQSR